MPRGHQQHDRRTGLRRSVLVCAAVLLAALVAGCGGSRLDPRTAVAANAAVDGRRPGAGPPTAGPATWGPGTPAASASTPGAPAAAVPAAGAGSAGRPGSTHHRPATGQPALPRQRASCAGFRNQTGVTDTTITVANVADVSGPVPGIFRSAQLATRAFAAYFDATSDLCGRELRVLSLDSRTDAAGDQVAYTKACDTAFAAVGSMSAFDSGGAATAQGCGLPDVRTAAVSDARNSCTTCFGVQATDLHAYQNAVPDFLLQHYPAAARRAAMIYVNEAASVQNAQVQQAAEEKRGMAFVYSAAFDVAEFNYAAYVQKMKEKNVGLVQFVGSADEAVRLARAMQEGGFRPAAFVLDPTAYDPMFVRSGGTAIDGALVFIDFTPLEEAAGNAELRLYQQWLQQVSPGAVPTYFGLFAWSATRLFVEQAAALGGRLSRPALVARMRGVHGWTAHGLHAPQDVGGKTNSNCWRFLQLRDGRWSAVDGRAYLCHGQTAG